MNHWKYCLRVGDYHWQSPLTFERDLSFRDARDHEWLHIRQNGVITVRKDYAWDGCSPTLKIFDWFYLGTPDGAMDEVSGLSLTYHASLIHDALYQFRFHPEMPLTRKQMDQCFLARLTESQYSLRTLYYGFVRIFGGVYNHIGRFLNP